MKLKQYLKESHLKNIFIAEKLNVSESHVSMWVTGKMIPRKETMLKIEKLTGGKVKISDWFTE